MITLQSSSNSLTFPRLFQVFLTEPLIFIKPPEVYSCTPTVALFAAPEVYSCTPIVALFAVQLVHVNFT